MGLSGAIGSAMSLKGFSVCCNHCGSRNVDLASQLIRKREGERINILFACMECDWFEELPETEEDDP